MKRVIKIIQETDGAPDGKTELYSDELDIEQLLDTAFFLDQFDLHEIFHCLILLANKANQVKHDHKLPMPCGVKHGVFVMSFQPKDEF